MTSDADGDLDRLRAIALTLPGAAERSSDDSPASHTEGGEDFARLWRNHDRGDAVLVRTAGPEEAQALIDADSALFLPPHLPAPAAWVAMRIGTPHADWDHIGDRVARSWELTAPRRYLEAGGG